MGVTNIITFDAHNASVMNAIPYHGFENVHPTYQMLKALVAKVPDISITAEDLTVFLRMRAVCHAAFQRSVGAWSGSEYVL